MDILWKIQLRQGFSITSHFVQNAKVQYFMTRKKLAGFPYRGLSCVQPSPSRL